MKKLIFSTLFFSILSFAVNAQSSSKKVDKPAERTYKEKTFHSIGTSVYMDIYNSPISEKFTSVTDPFGNTTSQYEYARLTGVSYFTLIYHYRYNLHEVGDNMAFSLNGFPSLGLVSAQSSPDPTLIPQGYGCFNIPIMAGFEAGAAATQGSSDPVGIFLGAGYEFNAMPLVFAKTVNNKDLKTKWLNPCVSIGFRYERSSNFGNLQEINLKIGMGLANQEIKEPNNLGGNLFMFTKAMTFRLSYFTYLNY